MENLDGKMNREVSDRFSEIIKNRPQDYTRLRRMAEEISALIEDLSPLITTFTDAVCPRCLSVCCIERHSIYAYDDLVYLSALGEGYGAPAGDRPGSDPCRCLGPRGCTMSHSRRPYRCTWYFCTALLEQIGSSAKAYRQFVGQLEAITRRREGLFEEFRHALERAGVKR